MRIDLADLYEQFSLFVFFHQVFSFNFIEIIYIVVDFFMLGGNIFFCILLNNDQLILGLDEAALKKLELIYQLSWIPRVLSKFMYFSFQFLIKLILRVITLNFL